ncbi:PAS domain-containing protein, partial [Methylobacterium frigidaeris]
MTAQPPAPDYRSLFEAAPHPYLVLDPQGRVVAANRAYRLSCRDDADRGPDGLVGRHLGEVCPDEGAPLQASIARAVATGRPDTVAPEGVAWSVTHIPVRDATGAVGAVLHHRSCPAIPSPASQDTLDLQDTSALQEAHQRREQIFQQMPGFVAVLRGPTHVFEYVNDAYVAIAGERDFVGHTVHEAFP